MSNRVEQKPVGLTAASNPRSLQMITIGQIEHRAAEPVDRQIGPLAEAVKGDLAQAAQSIVDTRSPHVVLATGFFISSAEPPAAETDGPLGTAHLAAGLRRVGVPVRVLTDQPCAQAVRVAIDALSEERVELDVVEVGDSTALEQLKDLYRKLAVTHVIAIERPGPGADGQLYDMGGQAIGAEAASFASLLERRPWVTTGIGDGGNELGMGRLDHSLIAENIEHGARIACRTPTDQLIVAGTSNWGAVALLAAVAVLRPPYRRALLESVTAQHDAEALRRLVDLGPAVDGVSKRPAISVDGLSWADYWRVCQDLAELGLAAA